MSANLAGTTGTLRVVLSTALICHACALAQANETAKVTVSVKIEPVAYIEFPDGFDFVIEVPDKKTGGGHDKGNGKGHDSHGKGNGYGHEGDDWAAIEPVFIPFRIRGNAMASVSVSPSEFMRIRGGYYLGKAMRLSGDRHKNQRGKGHDKQLGGGHYAEGHDDEIGYNIIVQFPIASWHYAGLNGWDGTGATVWPGFTSLPGVNGSGTPPLSADVSLGGHGAAGMIYVISKREWTENGDDAAPGSYGGSVEVTIVADET